MIRFLCPRCDSSLSASRRKVGTFCACPKCRQQLQVPAYPELNGQDSGSGTDVLSSDWRGKALAVLRWSTWAACSAWCAVLAWPYLRSIRWEEFPSLETWSVAGAAPLMFGGYVLARAIDSLSRR